MSGRSLTLAKLTRPRLHEVLARPRLFAQLDEVAERPVVWLAASPGAGKTTLLASYLESRQRRGIWYQVDPGDADPASFVYHLGIAARALDRGGRGGGPELPLLAPEHGGDLEGFARRFFRALFARLDSDAAMVLDNFQEVADDDAGFHRLVKAAVGEIPPGITVFVLSRSEPGERYATVLADARVACVDGDALRMTLDEVQDVAQQRGIQGPQAAAALQASCQGWAAGLTLLLSRSRTQPWEAGHGGDDEQTLQHVFGYFAERVFDSEPAPRQQLLLQLAFLPWITQEIAVRLTGAADAGPLLSSYHKRQLFVERRHVAMPAGERAGPGGASARHAYQFHALFRAFLQHRARSSRPADELNDVMRRAGRLLDESGQWEAALDLLAQAGDWSAFARVLSAHTQRLIEHGRRQTLREQLDRLPADVREADPWLDYWHGRASAPTAPNAAVALLERTFERFAAAGDALGRLACGAAIVQAFWYARLGWSEIAPWADRLAPLLSSRPRFPSPTLELATWSALHAALTFCRLDHPAIASMASRLLTLIDDDDIGWNERLFAATHLMAYFHNAADAELAARLIARVDPAVETLPASALNRSFWFTFRAIHDVRLAHEEAAAARFERAEALAHEDGLAHAEFAAIQFRAYLSIMMHRAPEAKVALARLAAHPARGHADAEMNLHLLRTLWAQQQGDAAGAVASARHALQAVRSVGAAYFQAVYPPMLASAFADAGELEQARTLIATSRALVHGNYLEAMLAQLALEDAYIEHTAGRSQPCLQWLADGLRMAVADRSRAAYVHRIVARKPVLLHLALAHGIEPDFVRQLVRQWDVAPPPQELPSWPWPLKIRTLGRFEVRVDDAPIAFGRKAPRKTLALLKAIIARGGSAPEATLIDWLWPDEEGDAAVKSLGAAVHRLRALLGARQFVVQQGGQLSLDRSQVWVDAWAFERSLAAASDESSRRESAVEAALALYQGAFLAEEDGEAWPVGQRERLRGKFIHAVADHGARLEAGGRHDDAIAWYLRGLDADPVVEPFYQGLMRCYHRLDRLPEAVSAYRRLKQTLSIHLSLPPSPGTEKLYRSLRLS